MKEHKGVRINKLPSGVPGLDEILGGGLPEFSFNIVAGAPGCGKTTLAHQFIFANATSDRPALYFTVLGEPALKMLRYQQQYSFFDVEKLNDAVRFINLSQVLVEGGLQGVLAEISKQVEASDARIVVVDSFRSVLRSEQHDGREMAAQVFVQELALLLTSAEATTDKVNSPKCLPSMPRAVRPAPNSATAAALESSTSSSFGPMFCWS